jgi:hypothetical protein
MWLQASGRTDQREKTFLELNTTAKSLVRDGTHHKFCEDFVPLIPSEIHRHLCRNNAGESIQRSASSRLKRNEEDVHSGDVSTDKYSTEG